MISLQNVSLRRGTRVLFEEVNLTIYSQKKIGVVGKNGSGKSSLFSMLQGELLPDSGQIDIPKKLLIAEIKQETPALLIPAIEFVIAGDLELCQVNNAIEIAEQKNDGTELAALHQKLIDIDGYTASARAAQLLHGLGFKEEECAKTVATFSGGWRMRLNLAKALMCRSDLLFLDEPTNHLDLDAIVWLEKFLNNYKGTLLLISHDRDFLDAVTEQIIHIDRKNIKLYKGNYSQFELLRAEQLTLQQAMYDKQQKKVQHLQTFIDRFKAKATKAKQAQSRIKALEKLEIITKAHIDSDLTFEFIAPEINYNFLMSLKNISVGYQKPLLSGINIIITQGLRLGLLGRNGAGKSTFIKLIAGELKPLEGEFNQQPKLKIGYFAQHQIDCLNPCQNAMQHLQALDNNLTEQSVRNFLGSFGFSGDKALSKIATFSGGEKSRLALALIAWQRPNLLLLDEPTNHLDLEMRHALTVALQSYQGAIILVSHDRYLLRSITDELLLVEQGKVKDFSGDLDDYYEWLNKNIKQKSISSVNNQLAKNINTQSTSDTQRKKKKIEHKLKQSEIKLKLINEELLGIEHELNNKKLYDFEKKEILKKYLLRQSELIKEQQQVESLWLQYSDEIDNFKK